MFAGSAGSGAKEMPSKHSEIMPEKCITCHMHREEEDKVLKRGGHTFLSNKKICLKCHEDPESMMAEWKAKISPILKELESLLKKFPDKKSKIYKDATLSYEVVIADGKIGSHNPRYAQALLQYSISSLTFDITAKPKIEKPESQKVEK